MDWNTINKKWRKEETKNQISWYGKGLRYVTMSSRFGTGKWGVYAEGDRGGGFVEPAEMRVPQILTKKEAKNIVKKYIEMITWW